MGETSRVAINLGALIVLAIALAIYGFITWIDQPLFDDRYDLVVTVPDAGGIAPDQAVTVRGVRQGTVEDMRLTPDGVEIRMAMEPDGTVPRHAMVHVLRRSPIGEQAIDFTPLPEDWNPPEEVQAARDAGDDPQQRPDDRPAIIPDRVPVATQWEPAEPDEMIDPVVVVLPSSVPELLDKFRTLLAEVDNHDAAILVTELAQAVDGRVDLIRQLNRDAADLGSTLVDGIPDFERLIRSSEPVLGALRNQRDTLAQSFTNAAALSDTLAANRPDLDRIVDAGPPFLRQADAFVRNERASLTCLVDDFGTLNQLLAREDNLEYLARILDLNRFFYHGVDMAAQWDPYRPGVVWARVNILLFEDGDPDLYVPPRDTPPTLPGAACESPFGVGVNAVRQSDPAPVAPDPTSPGIFYAPLVEDDGPARIDPAAAPDRRDRAPRTALPATGGGVGLVPIVALTLAGAALAVRRRSSR
jgi:ABC-type transporter Mla subunit MlaD